MFLAMKEIMHSKMKFSMIAIIFVLIAWLVFILSGLGTGLSTLAASTLKTMKADYVVFEEGSQSSMSKSLLSEQLLTEVELLPNVSAAAPMGSTMATALKEQGAKNEDKVDIAIIGINPGSFLEPTIVEGESLTSENSTGVLVNLTMKDEGYSLGDTFQLDGTTESLTIIGFVKDQTYNHVASVFTPMEEWRKISFAAPGSDKGIPGPVNAIMLQGKDIDPEVMNSKLSGTDTVTRAEAVQGMPGYKEENGTILMMLAFLLAISAFVLGVFFYVITMQKSNQFGIMKAIGASNKFLGKAIISQVFIISLTSIVIGILLTYGTAAIMPKGMPFKLETNLVVIYSLILLIIAVLSSMVSVRKITKIDPLQALGRVE
ncbi:cell division protein FtsX [Paenibacillus sp. VTT E-133280]|jgi:putative ABC transport system permease protein|uniref:ABC transporter permease n=1 Tax=unclassified Paenibacillus TaxID=185978 RepID=UPI000BA000CE|nr:MULTISPECIES: ABC transporter permease [unclassified Paenibacillus]MDH6372680.1 putative ABC transport system permease protein [Paenibacillus sp. PastF-3]OZQ70564.1 cell division protein FtsX [Paenibacillus sp. VTT E-133280]OZQ97948.1 cell division protein FtsX [Paenibacillus sp. VTT E-133291]